jgi:hypothetical protein
MIIGLPLISLPDRTGTILPIGMGWKPVGGMLHFGAAALRFHLGCSVGWARWKMRAVGTLLHFTAAEP